MKKIILILVLLLAAPANAAPRDLEKVFNFCKLYQAGKTDMVGWGIFMDGNHEEYTPDPVNLVPGWQYRDDQWRWIYEPVKGNIKAVSSYTVYKLIDGEYEPISGDINIYFYREEKPRAKALPVKAPDPPNFNEIIAGIDPNELGLIKMVESLRDKETVE